VGVNVSWSWLLEAATVLNCKVSSSSILASLGESRCLNFWDPVVNHIKLRLSGSKSKHLSFGGRLVLLKSVLISLHVYALSFFKAPSDIISSIVSLLLRFFGVGVSIIEKSLGLIGILFVFVWIRGFEVWG